MTLQSILLAGVSLVAGVATVSQVAADRTASSTAGKAVTVVTGGTPSTAKTLVAALPSAKQAPAKLAPQPEAVSAAALPAPMPSLPPLDLSDMWLWNWNGKWHASEWGNGMSPLPWKYDHVSQPAKADTTFTLDAAGAPQLQAMGGTPPATSGLWEADVTLPKLKDGLIVAPLWLWEPNSRDEVDFEYAGRNGLDVTLHAAVNGAMQQNTVRLFAGRDMSGERHRFGIRINQAQGFVEMYMDGTRVHRWDRAGMAFFVSQPLKPMIEMWAADPNNGGFVYWAGRWQGLTVGERLAMTVHGYRYTAG